MGRDFTDKALNQPVKWCGVPLKLLIDGAASQCRDLRQITPQVDWLAHHCYLMLTGTLDELHHSFYDDNLIFLISMRRLLKQGTLSLILCSGSIALVPAQGAPNYGSKSLVIPIQHQPFVKNSIQYLGSPSIMLAFPQGSSFTEPTPFVLDTGSTGIAVSTEFWDPNAANAKFLGSGNITYSSSGKIYSGNWYTATVAIGGPGHLAEATLPVLSVNALDCQASARDCTKSKPGETVTLKMFGVGFARAASSSSAGPNTQVSATPYYNPLLNITKLNGTAVTASTPAQPGAAGGEGIVGDFNSGYILTRDALTLGLTAENTAFFPKLLSLDWENRQSATGFYSGYADWQPVPATLTVNGTAGQGVVLTDTGLNWMFATPASGTMFTTDSACGFANECLAPGTTVGVAIDSMVSYEFTIGPTNGAALQPAPVAAPEFALAAVGDVFVNTSSQFFAEYNYLYDYVNGQVGYISNQSNDLDAFIKVQLGKNNQVPGPLPVVGAAVTYHWSRRLRNRLRHGGNLRLSYPYSPTALGAGQAPHEPVSALSPWPGCYWAWGCPSQGVHNQSTDSIEVGTGKRADPANVIGSE